MALEPWQVRDSGRAAKNRPLWHVLSTCTYYLSRLVGTPMQCFITCQKQHHCAQRCLTSVSLLVNPFISSWSLYCKNARRCVSREKQISARNGRFSCQVVAWLLYPILLPSSTHIHVLRRFHVLLCFTNRSLFILSYPFTLLYTHHFTITIAMSF